MAPVLTKRIISRKKMLEFLSGLEAQSGENSHSLYIPSQTPRQEIEGSLTAITVSLDISPQLTDVVDRSPTGAVIFWSPERKYTVLPPFPVMEYLEIPEFSAEKLRLKLKCDYLIGLVLVRLGAYAVGVCRGEALVSSKVGTGNIHARHKKGGSSAHRFERHRDKQMEYFFTRVCRHAREHLEPHVKALDYMVYGGARTTILELQKQCGFLGKLEITNLPSLLDIREPRQAVLETTVRRVWSSTVYEWQADD